MGLYSKEAYYGSALTKYEIETRSPMQHKEETTDMMDSLQQRMRINSPKSL